MDKTDSDTGTTLPATTQEDRFTDTQVGFYVEIKIQWAEKFRTVAALRGDVGHVDVTSLVTPANSGTATKVLPSPKLGLIFSPGPRLSSMYRADSVFTATTRVVQRKWCNRSRTKILIPIRRPLEFPF